MSTTRKQPAAKFVAANIDRLRAADYPALVAAGREAGYDSRAGFSAYKRALKNAGIDYDGAQRAHRDGRAEQHAADFADADEVRLVTDAAASHSRYAVTTADGTPVWFGRFFDDDEGAEQSAAELAAAQKAVWVTGKLAKRNGRPTRLILTVDAEWLTWANESAGGVESKRGGKAKQLARAARKAGIDLRVEWTSGKTNVADRYTRTTGYLKWQDGVDALESALTPAPAAA